VGCPDRMTTWILWMEESTGDLGIVFSVAFCLVLSTRGNGRLFVYKVEWSTARWMEKHGNKHGNKHKHFYLSQVPTTAPRNFSPSHFAPRMNLTEGRVVCMEGREINLPGRRCIEGRVARSQYLHRRAWKKAPGKDLHGRTCNGGSVWQGL
jgi:hypothetical protein